jgi:hypothetical protein
VKLQKAKAVTDTLKAWCSSAALRSYEWQFWPRYWYFRRIGQRWSFHTRKWNFHAKSFVRGTAEGASIFTEIVRSIFWQFTFAIVIVVIFCVFERFGETRQWPIVSRGIDAAAQLNFFATLLQVSAGFLALYFTAISVVTSTGYARTPSRVRFLVMQEQVGSLYFRTLAQFVGMVTVMLTAIILKIHIGILNTFFASALCLFAAYSFVVLGIRTFQYFDPIALAPHLNRLILKAVHAVTPQGYQWSDSSFQRHHQQNAQNFLARYADLVMIAAQKESLTTNGLVELATGLLNLTEIYAIEKHKIPTSSLWFRKRHKHKEWLLTPDHEVEIALATGTIPQPENEPELLWFEVEIANILSRASTEIANREDTAALATLATRLTDTMTILCKAFAVDEAVIIFDSIAPSCRKQYSSKISQLGGGSSSEIREALALIEGCSCGLINAVLGLSRGVAALSVESFKEQWNSLNWLSAKGLYRRAVFPREMLKECEWVGGCLRFEFLSEKEILTPDWFCKERPARGYVKFLITSAQIFVEKFEKCIGTEAERLIAEKQYLLVAQLVQRGLEYADKLSRTVRELHCACDAFSKFNRSKEWEWPTFDWAVLYTKIVVVRDKLVDALAEAAPQLAAVDGENLPDYFGQAYSVLADECLAAMIAGNEKRFSVLFPRLFASTLLAFDKLRQKLASNVRSIRLSAAPLVDLLALSGYGCMFSALDGKGFESIVTRLWDAYFTAIADASASKQVISLFSVINEPTGGILPRDILRMRWKRTVEGLFRERNIVRNRNGYFDASIAKHSSPLIRVFARRLSLLAEPEHVFLSVYLSKRPEAVGIEWPQAVEEFERSLAQEKSGKEEDEEE